MTIERMRLRGFFKPGIRGKIALLNACLVLAFCGFMYLAFPAMVERQQKASMAHAASALADLAAYTVAPAMVFRDSAGIADIIMAIAQDRDVAYLVIVDEAGTIAGSFRHQGLATEAGVPLVTSQDDEDNPWVTRASTPILHGGNQVGKAIVGMSLENMHKTIQNTRRHILFISVIMLVVGILVTSGISVLVTARLSHMVKTVEAITEGKLDTRVEFSSADEVGLLARDFNKMVERLSSTQHELSLVNTELERRVLERTSALEKSLGEKEILLKEVHHRVKNNLQIICSLLNLQGMRIADGQARHSFLVSQQRVRSMAIIHDMLYRSSDLSSVDLSQYVSSLSTHLFRSYTVDTGRIHLKTDIDEIPMTLTQAIPCGLLINELVTNAIKYAFPGDRTGTIAISFHRTDAGRNVLTVSDDGIGLPPDALKKGTDSLGMTLVSTLTEQLDGELSVARERGTSFTIVF